MSNIIISVIVPFVNHKEHIVNCWESLSQQTFSQFEVIFVNNGSTDGSDKIAEELALRNQQKIRVVSEQNKGIPFARNRGLKEAKGEFISFLDVDDSFTSNKLSALYNLIHNSPDASMAYGQTLRIYSESGKQTIQDIGLAKEGVNNPPELAIDWTRSFYYLPQTGATLVRTSSALKVGGFPEGLLMGNDDVGFHINIALHGSVIFSPFVAVNYYRHQKSEGARINESMSVNYRYFDAHNKFTTVAGKEYYNSTGDIRLWGMAQKGLFLNYILCKFKHKSKDAMNLKEPFFGFYSFMIIIFKFLPYQIAMLKYKFLRRIVFLFNADKYPLT